jgi:radical SAM superfamily enzyme YgiQ (UPF0313 family)
MRKPATHKSYTDWYAENGHRLTGYGVWLRGGEPNTLPAEAYSERRFRLLIARLSSYFDTVDSWTHKLLYALAVKDPDTFADLAYLPPPNDIRFFGAEGVPLLIGTGTKRGPAGFHLLALSNSCIQELINLPRLLAGSGIPLKKSERLSRPDIPLVLLGGANAMNTPALWTSDPAIDGVFVGESLEAVQSIFRLCRDARLHRVPKGETLEVLETVEGFFQPDRMRPTRISHDMRPVLENVPDRMPVLVGESQPGCAPVPLSEGCPWFCAFCAEAWVRKPYREYPLDAIKTKMDGLKAGMGLSQIEFSSFNFNAHSRLYDLLWHAAGRFDRIRLKSQRFDRVAADPAVMPILHAAGKTSITVGLEGISPRLRRYLNKQLDEDRILEGLRILHGVPLRELKVFCIATRLEGTEDFEEFEHLLDTLRKIQFDRRCHPRTLFSVTPLLRFPWTPLEFEDGPSQEAVTSILREMEKRVNSHGFEFRQSSPPHEYWASQVLARADDPRVGQALVETSLEAESLYSKTIPPRFVVDFRNCLARLGLVPDQLLRGAPPSESREKPWRRIRTGIWWEALVRQYEKNRSFEEVPCCLGSNAAQGTCSLCGACPEEDARKTLTRAVQHRNFTPAQFAERIRNTQASVREISLRIHADERNRGIPRHILAAVTAKALMAADNKLVPFYFGFKDSFWGERENPPWVWGDDTLVTRWSDSGVGLLSDRLKDGTFLETVNRNLDGWGVLAGIDSGKPEWFNLKVETPYSFDFPVFFEECGISGTLRKTTKGGFRYEFSKDSLRKKILSSLSLPEKEPHRWLLSLTVGPKFSVETFLKHAFVLPDPKAWVRISVKASFPDKNPGHTQ